VLASNVGYKLSVGKNVTVKASNFNKAQQLSTNDLQQVQYQSLKNRKFQQSSISSGIWFGTRGSEVQILSPRPFIFRDLRHLEKIKTDHLILTQVL
jgi:hypothetical protein